MDYVYDAFVPCLELYRCKSCVKIQCCNWLSKVAITVDVCMYRDSFSCKTLWWLICRQCSHHVWDLTYEPHPMLMFHICYCFFFSPQPLLSTIVTALTKGLVEGSCRWFAGMLVAWETGLKLCITDGRSSALQQPAQLGANARAMGQITSARLFNTFETRTRKKASWSLNRRSGGTEGDIEDNSV